MSTNDFDDAVGTAWSEFADSLAERLASLRLGEPLIVARADDPARRALLEFGVTSAKRVRCTVLDRNITEGLDGDQCLLLELGWRFLPKKNEYILEAGRRGIDDLLDLVAATWREIWEYAGPTFVDPFDVEPPSFDAPDRRLSAVPDLPDDLDAAAATEPATTAGPTTPEPTTPGPTAPQPMAESTSGSGNDIPTMFPTDDEHLLALAHATLCSLTGRTLTIEDGSIVLPSPRGDKSRVAVIDGAARLRLTVPLTDGPIDTALLGEFVAEHSGQWPQIALVADRTHVYAQRTVDCAVFHPITLDRVLPEWLELVDGRVPAFRAQLNPPATKAHSTSTRSMPSGLQAILALHSDEQPLTPAHILELTDGRVSRLHEYHRFCRDAAIEWRSTAGTLRADGADDDAEVHDEMAREFAAFADRLEEAIGLAVGNTEA
ncbi:TY-Chap domain-containing protein [Gordonia sp. NPDC003424]